MFDYRAGNILRIRNPKTGRTMSFILSRIINNQDNDITKFIYTPCNDSEGQLYNINHLTIFND